MEAAQEEAPLVSKEHMIRVRADEEDVERWRAQADVEKLSLSEWLRRAAEDRWLQNGATPAGIELGPAGRTE